MASSKSGKNRSLATYRSRRDFSKSPEPSGDEAPRFKKKGNPIFVIQKHDASTLHYDVRLEIDGALESWAVPKGPSTDPKDKRLAVHVERHPLDYADFEGVIPEGEYGGGSVIVWDAGPYRNLREEDEDEPLSMKESLEDGRVEVWLEGKKLRGGYAFVHSKLRGKDENWLLVKMKDDAADARRNPTSTEPKSVLSGRTVEEVAEEKEERAEKKGR